MKYNAPMAENGKQYWVPIVCKDKSYLIGYLEGSSINEMLTADILESMDIKLEMENNELYLDSSRFNDIMEDGRREHELTKEEKQKMFVELFKEKFEQFNSQHPDNITEYNDVLSLLCNGCYGYYTWKDYKDIPDKQFKCLHCGRVLIDYTGYNDYDYEFDEGEK